MSLEQQDTIQRMRRLRAGRAVLSVYLETEPGLALHHGHVARLMDMLRELQANVPNDQQGALGQEAERILGFVREAYVPSGRTLVVFSSGPRRLFETVSLHLPLRTMARFAPRPYLLPLDLALEDHPRVAVALVGEEKTRFLTTVLDEIESQSETKEHVPGRQRQGGWSAFKYQRDRERHIHEHFAGVVDELRQLQKSAPYKWLVLAGADDATSAVAKLLPASLKAKLAGRFREEHFETSAEVARQAVQVAEKAEREEELQLATQIKDLTYARGSAALGWDTTLRALAEGRVHRLAISAGELSSADADRAVELASGSGAEVEVVHGAAEEVLAPHRGVGALLRY